MLTLYNFSCSCRFRTVSVDQFHKPPNPRREKYTRKELGFNPSLLDRLATALTTRPCLLRPLLGLHLVTLKTYIDGTEIPKMNEFCAQINALPRKGESLIKATVELLNSFQPSKIQDSKRQSWNRSK